MVVCAVAGARWARCADATVTARKDEIMSGGCTYDLIVACEPFGRGVAISSPVLPIAAGRVSAQPAHAFAGGGGWFRCGGRVCSIGGGGVRVGDGGGGDGDGGRGGGGGAHGR